MLAKAPVLAVFLCLAAVVISEDGLPPRLQLQLQDDPADRLEGRPKGGVALPPTPTVNLTEGEVTGEIHTLSADRTILAYQGIPFGEPTGGANRFKPPVKKGYYGAINATWPSYNCPQEGIWESSNEDCLYLNVYTPKLPNSTYNPKMAVMVFIYGGAWIEGGSSIYTPGRLLSDRDVILVTPHYRLSVLGFFTTLTDEAPGNVANMDQILALQWVQDNIEAFGGDKDKVTIFGESAGGASVSLLLVSPLAKGLFRGAIAESGSAVLDWAYNDDPLLTGRQLAEMAGCQFEEPYDDLLECMRNVSVDELVRIGNQFARDERSVARNGFDGLNPVIQPDSIKEEYRFLPKDPTTMIKEGNFNSVPTIHGNNKNEGSFVFGTMYNDYIKVNNLTNDTEFFQYEAIGKMLGAFHVSDPTGGVVESITNQYFYYVDSWDVNTMYPGMEDLTGVFGIKAGGKQMTDMLSAAGTPTWMYSFDYRGQKRHTMSFFLFTGNSKLPFDMGVTHADELMYLFPIPLMSDFNEEERHVAKMMTEMWTNFAMHLDPTPPGSGLTRWPTTQEDGLGSYLQITNTATVKHDFTQSFVIAVDEHMNATLTTPAPEPTTSPAPPSSSTESSCQRQLDDLSSERDTFRGATIGLAVLAGIGVLVVVGVAVMMSRSRRRNTVRAEAADVRPHA